MHCPPKVPACRRGKETLFTGGIGKTYFPQPTHRRSPCPCCPCLPVIYSRPPPRPLVSHHHHPLIYLIHLIHHRHAPLVSSTAIVPKAAALNATPPSHRVSRLPAAATESSSLVCHHCCLSSPRHASSPPPPLLLLLLCHRQATSRLHFCCLLSNGVTVSHPPSPPLVSSSRLPPLPYLMAGCQCQVIASSGPRRTLSDASARGIGAKGSFPPAAAMVVMVVVVGRWRPRGKILWGEVFSEASSGKMLASVTKIARLITRALARNRTPKLKKLDL